ncbi:MAG TPA: NAD-dependent epimerase/dehydratase family protein [Actinotalea sp.]|jgi:nucleoside-diphosphate-sugar epimerase
MAKHLVVGAGPVGTATARLLLEQGHDVVVATRSGTGPDGAPSARGSLTRVSADASSPEAMSALARDAVAIYNCANPPYHRWPTDWPPIATSLLAAAESSGAVLATVSNLYGYGPVDVPMTEDLPLAAQGAKGRTRADMWEQALAAHDAGRVRATEVRGSDYLCAGPNAQLGDRVTPSLLRGKAVSVLRSADQPHSWTSVDDVARLLVTVASDERGWGRPWHVPSNAPRTQREVVADLCRVAGVPPVTVREHPAVLMRLLGLVSPMIREVAEVAYQFERPFVIDSTAAHLTFGLAPTPWDEILAGLVAAYRPVAAQRAA